MGDTPCCGRAGRRVAAETLQLGCARLAGGIRVGVWGGMCGIARTGLAVFDATARDWWRHAVLWPRGAACRAGGLAVGAGGRGERSVGDGQRGARRAATASHTAVATARLVPDASPTASPAASRISTRLSGLSKPLSQPTRLTTSRSTPLRCALRRPRSASSASLSAVSAADRLPRPARGDEPGEDVRVRRQLQAGNTVLLPQFRVRDGGHPVVGDRRDHRDHVGRRRGIRHRRFQFGGGAHAHDLHARVGGCLGEHAVVDVGGDERDLGAAAGGVEGERGTLPAAGAVAEVPHRVDRLAGAAGRDGDPQVGEVDTRDEARRRAVLGPPPDGVDTRDEARRRGIRRGINRAVRRRARRRGTRVGGIHDAERRREDLVGLDHPARAAVAACERSVGGSDHVDAAPLQHPDVRLRGRAPTSPCASRARRRRAPSWRAG